MDSQCYKLLGGRNCLFYVIREEEVFNGDIYSSDGAKQLKKRILIPYDFCFCNRANQKRETIYENYRRMAQSLNVSTRR